MAPQPVEAVFVIFYGLSAHKAVYGRKFSGDSTYTKDYIQLTQGEDFRTALEQLFPRATSSDEETAIEYRWPGGTSQGAVAFQSADRPHLRWPISEGAPAPWRMTAHPGPSTAQTIPGDPNAPDAAAATQEHEALAEAGIQPYLVGIKLRDEPSVLHVRCYLSDPPDNLQFASTEYLPEPVRLMIDSVSKNRAFSWSLFDSHAAPMPADVGALVSRLEDDPTVLLTGPPGTGKTVLLDKLAQFVENPGHGVFFDPEVGHDAWTDRSESAPGKSRTLVLHPAFTYENLVMGLIPEPAPGGVGIRVASGPLVNLAHWASQDGRRALLVLDEFNRANAAAVLGDALALLDSDKRGKAHIDLPYADLPLDVPNEFEANGTTSVNHRFTLPANLWIVAAMNSSDRSVAPLDAALRRRFTIVEMAPDYDLLGEHLNQDPGADLHRSLGRWTPAHLGKLAVDVLKAVNSRIDAVLGPDFRLGHSTFWNVGADTVDGMALALASAFDHRVVQNLRLAMQDDDAALAAVLRAPERSASAQPQTLVCWWTLADPALGSLGSDRLHTRGIAALGVETAIDELRRQAGHA